jgi:hypothetical protein
MQGKLLTICFNTGSRIPLAAIDVFWSKLDNEHPAFKEGEVVDYGAKIDQMKEEVMEQPEVVRKKYSVKVVGGVVSE